jgi:predicted acylesterase/phospholipase RssA
MGLTLIRKSRGPVTGRTPRVALVLAGGAMSGGAFKVGGLKALDDYLVGRRITDLDLYVGLSAGSILAVTLAAGVRPDEMVEVLEGTSRRLDQLRPIDFYQPNFREFGARPVRLLFDLVTYLPGVAWDLLRGTPGLPEALGPSLRAFAAEPSYTRAEAVALALIAHVSPSREVPSLAHHLPSGFFDNAPLERWLRGNLGRLGLPNEFRAFERARGRRLYVSACDLDTAERVIFGSDEETGVTISQAVQASTALPIFYRPPRFAGVDYVDGGIRHTANIDVAIEKGADLVICYNPFRPFLNRGASAEAGPPAGRPLADLGLPVVLNQVFRTLLHSRLKLGIQRYLADDRFQGDIVLLEPREQEADFFAINPIAFWKRAEALRHGFESVHATIEQNFEQLEAVLGLYGLRMDRKQARRRGVRLELVRDGERARAGQERAARGRGGAQPRAEHQDGGLSAVGGGGREADE